MRNASLPGISPGRALKSVGYAGTGLLIFILALWLLKEGALGLKPLLARLQISGVVNALGFGWLMAYLVLSGSPVAAISLTLFGGGLLSSVETFAMLAGSRLGASFIVLFVGFVYWLRGRQRAASVSVGILSWLVTATIYLPAMALGYVFLSNHWFDTVRLASLGRVNSVIEIIYDPIVRLLSEQLGLPNLALFVLGGGVLLVAFRMFDEALPEIDTESSRFNRISEAVYRPVVMFLLGAGVTSVTLSVSVSLTMLVPLTVKGYVRRENIIPYIMGANITTFIDTLMAALLIPTRAGEPSAFVIVLTEMLSVAVISMLALRLNYAFYQRGLERVLEWILRDNRTLAAFIGLIFIIPLILLLL